MRGALSIARPFSAKGLDHPRRCGEHSSRSRGAHPIRGSSPQMRGAPDYHFDSTYAHRIIPADAGSTAGTRQAERASKDHPRRCGEHCHLRRFDAAGLGSSPQMRGAHVEKADQGSGGDHPRRCGEHPAMSGLLCVVEGSSPQMRGALVGGPAGTVQHGIIPADAGSTH